MGLPSEEEMAHLCKLVRLPSDMAAINTGRDNPMASMADIVAAAVRAALDCAVKNGLIVVVPQEAWPEFIVTSPPYQLPEPPNVLKGPQ